MKKKFCYEVVYQEEEDNWYWSGAWWDINKREPLGESKVSDKEYQTELGCHRAVSKIHGSENVLLLKVFGPE